MTSLPVVEERSLDMLFRVVVPRIPPHNVFRFQMSRTTPLGPIMVATAAKESCVSDGLFPWLRAEVIDENNCRPSRGAPYSKDGLPDHLALQRERYSAIVGFSCGISSSALRCLELVRLYKSLPENLRPEAVVVGGWHAMDNPEEFLQAGADVVVHGEAELIIKDLLTALRDGEPLDDIPGISYWSEDKIERNGPDELQVSQEMMDKLPDPDFGLIRYAKIGFFPIGRVRGCSGRCRFCRVRTAPRSISPERFLDQLRVLISKGVRHIFVVDDRPEENLADYLYWLEGLAKIRQERHIRLDLTTQNRLSLANHPEALRAMRKAGVRAVAIGFESPIRQELMAMRKPVNPDKMVEWAKTWKRFGFYVHAMFIFGYPLSPEAREQLRNKGEDFVMSAKERARQFWRFIRKINPDTLQVLLFTPLPGTEDRKFLKQEGRLPQFSWDLYDGTFLVFVPDAGVDPKELQYESIKLMRKFYAFHYFWMFGTVPLLLHLMKIGIVTIALPFVWWFVGFQPWHQVWRNAKRRFQGHLIVRVWLKNFERLTSKTSA